MIYKAKFEAISLHIGRFSNDNSSRCNDLHFLAMLICGTRLSRYLTKHLRKLECRQTGRLIKGKKKNDLLLRQKIRDNAPDAAVWRSPTGISMFDQCSDPARPACVSR